MVNPTAIAIFALFVLVSLYITYRSRRRVRNLKGFYSAGSSIKPWQNGLAITGDYLSAASFLGTVAVFYSFGLDGLFYAVGAVAGWPVVTCLIAEPLRARGRFTFSDAMCHRLSGTPVRILTACSTLCICGTYLIAQIVGAGSLIELLFHIPYRAAVLAVGSLMLCYVLFGGMLATTWVQIIKATVLLSVALLMTILLLKRFDFNFGTLAEAASGRREVPLLGDSFSAVSLALAFAFGPAGMPHILMRFFTVTDGQQARHSLVITTLLIALFQVLVIALGLGASTLLGDHRGGTGISVPLPGGPNMAVVHLAQTLGGDLLFGVVAAVTFATIVAVVAGLTLAAAAAVSHDHSRGRQRSIGIASLPGRNCRYRRQCDWPGLHLPASQRRISRNPSPCHRRKREFSDTPARHLLATLEHCRSSLRRICGVGAGHSAHDLESENMGLRARASTRAISVRIPDSHIAARSLRDRLRCLGDR
jgi:cation/acetate symporter